ncbi:MAG: 16S rRNA (cytidine(1402)-2'-O)-methyltransferase [Gemmatimonadetes bacterium]|nr:16S rRNA (cytidine(1402)-2'-O)-methyltransferase [Gemmatimonadota bacterium]
MTIGEPAKLYLVGTPIGNRGDMTSRGRQVLADVPAVACEDTRTCRRLFAWLDVSMPDIIAYHDHNIDTALPTVIARLETGDDVALVTDAGMPAIQDPGYRLVVAARQRGIEVVPVPGPSALLVALAASGLPTDRFAFLGFAPRRGRESWWREALTRPETIVVYEAPGRVGATVAVITDLAPDRPVCLARELTKLHEEFVTGTAKEVSHSLVAREKPVKGECVLVVGGSGTSDAAALPWPTALARLEQSRAGHAMSARDRVEVMTCAYPAARNAIYRAVHGPDDRAGDPQ